jgi:threonine dehydrogenase-like Zn-dependent dehydrogenase
MGVTQYPVVPGHEVVGKIAEVGERVRHLTIGQSVGLVKFDNYGNKREVSQFITAEGQEKEDSHARRSKFKSHDAGLQGAQGEIIFRYIYHKNRNV